AGRAGDAIDQTGLGRCDRLFALCRGAKKLSLRSAGLFKLPVLSSHLDISIHSLRAFRADQSLLQTLIGETEFPGIEPKQRENCSLQVVDAGLAFSDEVAELVGGAVDHAAFDARAGQPKREAVRMMIAAQEFGTVARFVH